MFCFHDAFALGNEYLIMLDQRIFGKYIFPEGYLICQGWLCFKDTALGLIKYILSQILWEGLFTSLHRQIDVQKNQKGNNQWLADEVCRPINLFPGIQNQAKPTIMLSP